jgi:hypothetical protein
MEKRCTDPGKTIEKGFSGNRAPFLLCDFEQQSFRRNYVLTTETNGLPDDFSQ